MSGRFPARRWPMLAGVVLACVLTSQQVTAQALPSAVVACMNEHDPTQRLACYDREVPRAAATPGSAIAAGTPAPAPAAPTTGAGSAAPVSEVDAFGMTAQIQRKESGGTPPPRLDQLTAHIAAVAQKPRGESIVTLDNGQVWEEAEATSHLPLRAGDDITIKRGMLGAFYLSSAQVLGLRVKRVR